MEKIRDLILSLALDEQEQKDKNVKKGDKVIVLYGS